MMKIECPITVPDGIVVICNDLDREAEKAVEGS